MQLVAKETILIFIQLNLILKHKSYVDIKKLQLNPF